MMEDDDELNFDTQLPINHLPHRPRSPIEQIDTTQYEAAVSSKLSREYR